MKRRAFFGSLVVSFGVLVTAFGGPFNRFSSKPELWYRVVCSSGGNLFLMGDGGALTLVEQGRMIYWRDTNGGFHFATDECEQIFRNSANRIEAEAMLPALPEFDMDGLEFAKQCDRKQKQAVLKQTLLSKQGAFNMPIPLP